MPEQPRRLLLCRFEEALQEAQQVDKLLSEGPGDDYLEEKFPLLGVPITVKEAFSLHGAFALASLQLHRSGLAPSQPPPRVVGGCGRALGGNHLPFPCSAHPSAWARVSVFAF